MACVNHPDVPEVTRCAQCFRRVCENCHVVLDGQPLCADCKARTVRQLERGDLTSSLQREPSPWEKEKSFASLVETAKLTLLSPSQFFRGLAHRGSGHVSMAILLGWPGTVIGSLSWNVVPPLLSGEGVPDAIWFMTAVTVLFAPLQIVIGIYVGGAILHLCLKVFRGANAPIEASMRVMAYAMVPQVLGIVPFCGSIVAAFWALVVEVVGIKEMHETTYGKAIGAILLPAAVVCGCVVAVLVPVLLATLAAR